MTNQKSEIRNQKSPPAFTLVELVMVVAIIAIAAALATPMLRDADNTRLRAAANLLMADLAFAQEESIAHSDDLRLVVFDIPANSYRIAPASAPNTPITNPTTKTSYQTTFGTGRASALSGVTIHAYSLGGDDRIRFGPYGQLDQATAATVTLSAGTRSITVSMNPTTGETSTSAIN